MLYFINQTKRYYANENIHKTKIAMDSLIKLLKGQKEIQGKRSSMLPCENQLTNADHYQY